MTNARDTELHFATDTQYRKFAAEHEAKVRAHASAGGPNAKRRVSHLLWAAAGNLTSDL
jgi:hypothetical protein